MEESGEFLCDLTSSAGVIPQIEIDNKFVYKATVLKSVLNSPDALSKDRLKRIQGLTRHQPMNVDRTIDDLVLPGDPIIIRINNNFNIAIILKMFNGNKLIQNVHASEINNDVFKFSTKIISLTEINDKLFWDGSSTCPPDKKSLRRAGCNTRWNVGLLAAVIRGGMAAMFQGLHFVVMQLVEA